MSAAAVLSRVEPAFAEALRPQSSFSDRVAALLDRLDCRLAESEQERDAIYRLRYQAYLREGAIAPNPTERFCDPYDELENSRIFGLYLNDELASSIRIHVTSPEHS